MSLTWRRVMGKFRAFCMAGYPSGQRDQTVNLTAQPSKVRILLPPPLLILYTSLQISPIISLFKTILFKAVNVSNKLYIYPLDAPINVI